MPTAQSNAVHLAHSTLGELCDALNAIRQRRGDDLLVMTEVGLSNGADVFIGQKAITVRENFGQSITISADEPQEVADRRHHTIQEQVVR